MKRFTATIVLCALLAACAGTPKPQTARDAVGTFELEARFALRIQAPDRVPESSGGRLSWAHRDGRDRILIANTLGIGVAEIESTPGTARLITADGQTRESDDADALMQAVTGERLPVRNLPAWLLGRPGPQGQLTRDPLGRPHLLTEAGWSLDFTYADNAPDALPSTLTLRRNDSIELRLRIEEWNTSP